MKGLSAIAIMGLAVAAGLGAAPGDKSAAAGTADMKKTADTRANGDMADLFKRPAQRHAFVFSWGAVYGNLSRELSERGKVLHLKPGDMILHKAGGARYEYSFFRKSRVREMVARSVKKGGKETMVLERLILEPAEPAENARLFAVMVHFPLPMPFEGLYKKQLMESLNLIYGKAVNVHRHYFDMENTGTQVRVYLRRHRGKAYVLRLVFNSRSIARERNEHILGLRRKATGEALGRRSSPKPAPVMTSESPRTARTKFVAGDKVLADKSRSPRIKMKEKESSGDQTKIRMNKTRLVVDADRKEPDRKSAPPARRP